ncbi:MAG: pyruvate ferredoxin oxidoreductase gamma subunit [Clostridia bacterium]|jgi:pyruvate ferredoxin oxidoreductase gamma subunit|nr:pyruvate ferredoxin oxidoreductase gamma subunit [Clostridia bacterium]MDN5323125.1 pyruvate ferredoxin oxidoreductase gamma subunit [Clostridia bacterium]
MIEIRWHGRGGHGGFTAARLLGLAASVYSDNYAQAFPSFGPERRGAPVLGFTRIDKNPINDHSQVYSCDYVIVLDESLLDTIDVTKGIKDGGVLIINSKKPARDFNIQKDITVHTFDGTQLALDVLGVPITNTVMLGATVAITNVVSIDSIYKAIDDFMSEELREKNKKAVEAAYNSIKGVTN